MDEAAGEEEFRDSKCPYCSQTLSFPESSAGTLQECPLCGETVVVPRDDSPVAGKFPLPIRASRLLLRPLSPADTRDLAVFLSADEVLRLTDWEALDEAAIESAIQNEWANRLTQREGSCGLGAELDGRVMGFVWFRYLDQERRQGTVFVAVHPEFQRRGLGTEAVRAMLSFGFASIGLRRMTATCDGRNTAACRMLEKAGMRREGEFLQDHFRRGEWVNTACYAMLRDEFDGAPHRTPALDASERRDEEEARVSDR